MMRLWPKKPPAFVTVCCPAAAPPRPLLFWSASIREHYGKRPHHGRFQGSGETTFDDGPFQDYCAISLVQSTTAAAATRTVRAIRSPPGPGSQLGQLRLPAKIAHFGA